MDATHTNNDEIMKRKKEIKFHSNESIELHCKQFEFEFNSIQIELKYIEWNSNSLELDLNLI
jgi:hypothetical protein